MVVIYAEKASLAKEIANALNAGQRISNPNEPRIGHWEFIFNNEPAFLVHGQGHLVQLAETSAYGEQYLKWNTDVYPCIPDIFKLEAKSDTIKVLDYIKPFFKKADTIINATDPDREGELIFDYIYRYLNCSQPFKRVWIEDLTKSKIQYAFNHLKASDEILQLQKAARARAITDNLFGINFTVGFTAKYSNNNGVLSIGRVQSPTLAMVVNREKEINNFVKKPFYKAVGSFTTTLNESYKGELVNGNFDNQEKASAIVRCCCDKGTIKSKEIKQKSVNAPLLFNSTQLQIACGKKMGWDLKKAERVMQNLYEAKYMSYPRTNSEHLTTAMESEIAKTIEKIMQIPEYAEYKLDTSQWKDFTKRHFNDDKVGSHPAITPTLKVPASLSDIEDKDMRALYDLLCKSLMRIVYPSAQLEDTNIITSVDGYDFKSSGSTIVNSGWYCVDALPDKKNILPLVNEGDTVMASVSLEKGETKPPKRYTETDLIAAMELAGQKIEDEEARTLMKLQNKGLGTDATRVPIVQSLFAKGYMDKKGKSIYPTQKGIYIIDTLPVAEIKSTNMTGEMEKQLHDIEIGKLEYDAFISKIKTLTAQWYKKIIESQSSAFIDKSMLCPLCGNKLIKGKNNIFCSAYKSGCKLSIPYSLCGKKLTSSQTAMLIGSRRTNVIKGFVGKSGKEFNASLKINDSGQIEFVFSKTKSKK